MGLKTERGRDNIPDTLLQAAQRVANRIAPELYADLYELASNARQGISIPTKDWVPFIELLNEEQLHIHRRDDATALLLVLLPKVLKAEQDARDAAVKTARERMEKQGVRAGWGPNFRAPKKASESLNQSADQLASALQRLAKK